MSVMSTAVGTVEVFSISRIELLRAVDPRATFVSSMQPLGARKKIAGPLIHADHALGSAAATNRGGGAIRFRHELPGCH